MERRLTHDRASPFLRSKINPEESIYIIDLSVFSAIFVTTRRKKQWKSVLVTALSLVIFTLLSSLNALIPGSVTGEGHTVG